MEQSKRTSLLVRVSTPRKVNRVQGACVIASGAAGTIRP